MKGLGSFAVNWINRIEERLCPQHCGIVDRRRVIAYIFLTIIEVLVIPFHFFLFLTWWEPYGFTVACIHLVSFLVVQYMIWKEEIVFSQGLSAMYLLVALKLTADSFFCTFMGVLPDNVTVLGNVFVMFVLAVTAMAMMLNALTKVLLVLMVPLSVLAVFSQDGTMMLFVLKPILVGFVLVAYVYIYNMSRITEGLRQPREVMQEERKALEMLANLKDVDAHKEGNLIERLSPEMRQRIVDRASRHLRKEELDNLAWDMVCAELTKSEKEICRLILDGRSLKEICAELNKTESNITSQRSHIRKKLGMERTDDLQRTLELRIAEVRKGMAS